MTQVQFLCRQHTDALQNIPSRVRCFCLAGAERHQEMPAVFYLHVLHVLKEVHVWIMAVGQLDQILEFRICWERLNEAGKQRCVVLLDALQIASSEC